MAKRKIKKKVFIPIVAGVCAVLLIAEAVLLIHYFTKEKDTTKKPKSGTEEVTYAEPVPFAVKEAQEGFRTVWKVYKEYRVYRELGKVLIREVVVFDEKGREDYAREYDAEGNVTNVYYFHGPFGTKIVKADENERVLSVDYTDISGENYTASADYAYDGWEYPEEPTYTVEIPSPWWDDGLPRRITWELADDTTVTRKTLKKYSEDDLEIIDTAVISLDQEGRVIRYEHLNYREEIVDSVTEYSYDGDITTRTEYLDGKWSITNQFDERLQIYPHIERDEGENHDGKGIISFYRPDGRYPVGPEFASRTMAYDYTQIEADGTTKQQYTVELNRYGQPVLAYDVVDEGENHRTYYEFKYDENGHCKSIYQKKYYGEYGDGQLLVESTTLLKYDEYGNLIEAIDKESGEGYVYEWVPIEVEE